MPKEITKHKTILDAISKVDIISELVERHGDHVGAAGLSSVGAVTGATRPDLLARS